MGWWDTGILGGDTPLDYLESIEDTIGIEDLYPLSSIQDTNRVRIYLEENLEKITAGLGPVEDDDARIGWQVLAALACAVGATLDADTADKARYACANDDWAKTDPDRAQAEKELLDALDTLETGTPTMVQNRGLFDKLTGIW